jgi:hypothetical protein
MNVIGRLEGGAENRLRVEESSRSVRSSQVLAPTRCLIERSSERHVSQPYHPWRRGIDLVLHGYPPANRGLQKLIDKPI